MNRHNPFLESLRNHIHDNGGTYQCERPVFKGIMDLEGFIEYKCIETICDSGKDLHKVEERIVSRCNQLLERAWCDVYEEETGEHGVHEGEKADYLIN